MQVSSWVGHLSVCVKYAQDTKDVDILAQHDCLHLLGPVVHIGETDIVGRLSGTSGNVEFFGSGYLTLPYSCHIEAMFYMIGLSFSRAPVEQLRLNFPLLSTTINAKSFNAKDIGPGCLQTVRTLSSA